MRSIDRALSALDTVATIIGIACVTLMMLHVAADVAGRYLLNAPVDGTITVVSHYYMVFLGFIALGVAQRRDAHISVEIVTDLMPRRVQGWLAAAASLLAAVAFAFLAVRTWQEAVGKMEVGASMQQGTVTIPIWPSYFAVPIGSALMVLAALRTMVGHAVGKPPVDPRTVQETGE
jgi:TRAP-type C4-dicarboxylate transport system permease small subunit